MAKTKTPFFGLGSQGTIGDTLTSQKRGSATLLRQKPIPAYRYTLPQAYQRWLYTDYAYLWQQQNEATRREYARAGSPFHLTSFQYWMKYHLTHLPDIAGWWKLDNISGPTTPDSSRNNNPGAIFGASPAVGLIDNCLSFDGLNDYVNLGNPAALINMTTKSLILFFNAPAFTGTDRSLYYGGYWAAPFGDFFFLWGLGNALEMYVRNSAGNIAFQTQPFTPDIWHVAGYSWNGAQVLFFFDGLHVGAIDPLTGTIACTGLPITLGRDHLTRWHNSLIDNLIIFNRALDPTEHARWAERRYPA